MSDPWAPWAECDPAALAAVFDLPDFEAQCRALLDLRPNKISARDLSFLPWEEPHEPREFRAIRDAWALARSTKREVERERDEKPIEASVREQFENAVRTRNLKEANEALALLVKIGAAKGVNVSKDPEDDYERLTDVETLALGALCHKLRAEPLTELDQEILAIIAQLGPSVSAEA